MYVQWVVRDQKDTIYEYLNTQLSDGFRAYDTATLKYQTYDQMNAIVLGSPGTITYGPHTGILPVGARFASIRWTGAPFSVAPSFNSIFKCTQSPNVFDSESRAFKPNPSDEKCYPLLLTANVIFHHAYSNHEVHEAKITTSPPQAFWTSVCVLFSQPLWQPLWQIILRSNRLHQVLEIRIVKIDSAAVCRNSAM
jgi:hypothetical protein